MKQTVSNPHQVLGVSATATAEEVRSAYLAQVKLHPPDTDADRFSEIHAAYQMLSDPLVRARAIFRPTDPPDLQGLITAAEKSIARLPTLALLALGNTE